jgi:Epoxide hydrolase N terminus
MRAILTLAPAAVLSLVVLGVPGYAQSSPAVEDDSVRPFHINIPEEQIVELRQRIAATRWPDKELVNDESQGIRLAEMQALVHYWGTAYNWRKGEAKPRAVTSQPGNSRKSFPRKCERRSDRCGSGRGTERATRAELDMEGRCGRCARVPPRLLANERHRHRL